MNIKFIASVILAGGVLMFFEINPSDLLDQGSNFLGKFSGDFMALFNGEGTAKVANKISLNEGGDLQEICDAEPAAADDETSITAREINRERCEEIKNAKAIISNPEEIKQNLESQNITIEDLKKRMEESRKPLE
jgi:hypothetical protein